jgi:hypothetical protein
MPWTPQKGFQAGGSGDDWWDSASILSTFVSFAQLLYHNHPWRFYLSLPTNLSFISIITRTQFTIVVLLKSFHKSVFIRISSTALSLNFSTQHFSKLRITDHLKIPACTTPISIEMDKV